jgi:lysophospholipase L1-like esterase
VPGEFGGQDSAKAMRSVFGVVFACALSVAAGTGCIGGGSEGVSGGAAVKVACAGDSITFGAGIERRAENSYPAVLQGLLGPGFEVRNFGRNGATAQRKGDLPYWDQDEFGMLSVFGPDLVILMLGTNDAKPQNWESADRFEHDFRREMRGRGEWFPDGIHPNGEGAAFMAKAMAPEVKSGAAQKP